jgi:endonuclease G
MNRNNRTLIIILVSIAILCFSVAFVFLSPSPQTSTEITANPNEVTQTTTHNPDSMMEIPRYTIQRKGRQIMHTGYSVDFNPEWHIPNWVAYELTEEELQGDIPRSQNFEPDPQLSDCTPTTFDYSHSGYDRGHMAPAGNMKWNQQAMNESFYTSNICPQNHNLNSGVWQQLEEKVNIWACTYGNIYVVCGPIVKEGYETIGKNKVAVPDAFFKVLLCRINGQWQAIGFYFKNEAGTRPLRNYARNIDEIERLTGIDFFHLLDDSIENQIEARYQLDAWGL